MSDVTEQGPVWSLTDFEIGIPSGGSITWVDCYWIRAVSVDPQLTTLTFEGDDSSVDIDELNKVNLEAAADMLDFDALQTIFGKTKVTGISGETWAMYFGDDAETAGRTVGVRYKLKARDEVGNTLYALQYYWLRALLKVMRPQTAEWKAKHRQVLNFTASKTTVDAAGTALTGVPADGAYVRVSRLAAS